MSYYNNTEVDCGDGSNNSNASPITSENINNVAENDHAIIYVIPSETNTSITPILMTTATEPVLSPTGNAPVPDNLPQPFNEQPSPSLEPPPPQFTPLPNVVDLAVPYYFKSTVDRSVLLECEASIYTKDKFYNDFPTNRSCCPKLDEFSSALFGLVGIGCVIAGGVLFVTKTDWKYVLIPVGVILWLFYSAMFLCSSTICNYCCVWKSNGNTIDFTWFESMYTGYDDTTKDTVDAINQLSTDIPRLMLNVQCSHLSGGKKKHRVVTYNQNHVVPIMSYRNLGSDYLPFLTSLDSVHSGEVLINYVPKLILHPDQLPILDKMITFLQQQNQHRDRTCIVVPVLSTVNNNITVSESNDGIFFEKFKSTKSEIDLQIQTSLGSFMSVYRSNQKRVYGCFPSFCTNRHCWTAGAYLGVIAFQLFAWYSRFKKATFTNPFYLLLPDYEHYEKAYLADPDSFVIPPSNKTPPQVQTPAGLTPVYYKAPGTYNAEVNGFYNNLVDELPMPYVLTPIGTPQ